MMIPNETQGENPWNTQPSGNGWQGNWNPYGQTTVWQGCQYENPYAVPAVPPDMAPPAKPRRSKRADLVLNILTLCFVAFLIAGSTIFAFSNNESKSIFGYRFYNVLTPSMRPLFKPGDMIFVKLVEPSEIKVGDVVTFNPSAAPTAFLTHRVVALLSADETRPARMVTKGDANQAEDPAVDLHTAIGVHVFTVPLMGRVIEVMRGSLVFVCICLGAVFLLLMVLRRLLGRA